MPTTERPDSPAVFDRAADRKAAYVHIPFCARVCPYCDFAVVGDRTDEIGRYVEALIAEIGRDESLAPLDAIFVGGGTPSLLPAGGLARILAALADRHGIVGDPEITMEANPEDWTEARSRGFLEEGLSRVSFGVQSTDPRVLSALGRRHGPREVGAAVMSARRTGVPSISVDLIFGHPVETDASWQRTLEEVVELEPDHVSTYALTVERGTPLSRWVAEGSPAPDPDTQAARWEQAVETLGSAGYVRYEVSNHAKPGHHCEYNLGAWAGAEYVAYGVGAHGHRDGERFRNVRSLDAYVAKVEAGDSPRQGSEAVRGWEAEVERLFTGLRVTAGVPEGRAVEAFMESEDGSRLAELGVIDRVGRRLVVRKPLFTDAVARDVLGLLEKAP